MTPNIKTAIDFFKAVRPDGPWMITCIHPVKHGAYTYTFNADDAGEDRLADQIQLGNAAHNVYWQVNRTEAPMNGPTKPANNNITIVEFLHVDIDPPGRGPLEQEQDKIEELLTGPLPNNIPPPSIIVCSGNGYQALWKLDPPILIDGNGFGVDEVKRYNVEIAARLEGDNCGDVSRVLRLPGTVNFPSESKMRKGRLPCMSRVVKMDMSLTYPISQFIKAPIPKIGAKGNEVHVETDVPKLDSVEDLNKWGVHNRVKAIIVQGEDTLNPKEDDNSRSAWVFDVCCQLARCNVPDSVIYAVLTDPGFLISASVLEKGSGARKYAMRQIARAKENAISPWLARMNDRYAVIGNIGGKCRVIEDSFDEVLKRHRITRQSFPDFNNFYSNTRIPVGDKDMAVGQWWLTHPMRRTYDTITFSPVKEVANAYNLWRGFAVDPVQGNCSLFYDHMLNNICCGNKEHYAYLLGWMANAVQHPDTPGQVAVVMRGKQGTGKSFFAKTFGALFGRHFMQVSDPKHLVGSFNAHLRDCVVLFGDEAFFAGDRKHESILKTLITEERITIEGKGVDAEECNNYVHLLMASNSQWVIPAGPSERRYFALDVGDGKKQDSAYFVEIVKQLSNGGRAALLYDLINYDLSGFEVRHVPKTHALQEQKEISMSPEQEWWYGKLLDGRVFSGQWRWCREVKRDELFKDYIEMCDMLSVYRKLSLVRLMHSLASLCPGTMTDVRKRVDGVRHHMVAFPSLADCRDAWNTHFGVNAFVNAVPDKDTDDATDEERKAAAEEDLRVEEPF